MICHTNSHHKRSGMAILISDKTYFKARNVTRDNEGHFIIVKASVHKEAITIIKAYTPNNRDPNEGKTEN